VQLTVGFLVHQTQVFHQAAAREAGQLGSEDAACMAMMMMMMCVMMCVMMWVPR